MALLEYGRRISQKRKKEATNAALINDFFLKAEEVHTIDPLTPLSDSEFAILEAAHAALQKVSVIRTVRACMLFHIVQLRICSDGIL